MPQVSQMPQMQTTGGYYPQASYGVTQEKPKILQGWDLGHEYAQTLVQAVLGQPAPKY